ncbi:HlyD family secretion protein, partial [Achromobacter anxifer]
MRLPTRKLVPVLIALAVAAGGYYGWRLLSNTGPGAGFISGNGRIEATEIDVAAKLAGRVQDVLAVEGDFVSAGQPLARMQIDTLQAQREEARAQHQQAVNGAASASAQVAQRESDKLAAEAVVVQRESELDAARRRLARSETLSKEGASSIQELDDDRARVRSAQASVHAARAQVKAAQAAIDA